MKHVKHMKHWNSETLKQVTTCRQLIAVSKATYDQVVRTTDAK